MSENLPILDGGDDSSADTLGLDRATGDAPRAAGAGHDAEERAATALHAALTPRAALPAALRARLVAEGEAIVAARGAGSRGGAIAGRVRPAGRRTATLALAAALALAVGAAALLGVLAAQRSTELDRERGLLAQAREQIAANERLIAEARADADSAAAMLAEVTSQLDETRTRLATYEAPVDPVLLAERRRELLSLPSTVRLEWQPFAMGESEPAIAGVGGDVVWNDEAEQGYLRFTGLPVNDPSVEQYQVWVIDERGMEQKVSGGVFNASASGEVIVPIKPGIPVGRVRLFAITVEQPGGTWVPSLERRVVVAPRGG